jgi:hypothetical protein
MNAGQTLFSQLLEFLPPHEFNRCVHRYRGDHRVRQFSCRDQFLCMAFAQLTYRESLRDIETCLRSMSHKLYHAGFRATVARNTLAKANENRDWRIYADLAAVLIAHARKLYVKDRFAVDLDQTVYAFDSTTIDLCLTLFPWAQFRRRKSAVKLHTLIDLRGNTSTLYPDPLRRISYYAADIDKRFVFLTNNFALPALTIAQLYKCRWQVERFFKWIKQYLRIKAFYGTTINAVKTQVWIAVCVYVLVAIVKKELKIERSLGEILQILSISLFEKMPILQAFLPDSLTTENGTIHNQLSLFDF